MTKRQAILLVEAFDVESLICDEEREILEERNPELLEACEALVDMADSGEDDGK